MSTPKKVLFIELGVLALGIVVFIIGLERSPAFWQTFQCGYDLGLNNSSLTRDQISEYCNNQILKTEHEEDDLTIVGFGIILIVIGLIITGIGGGIWIIVKIRRTRRGERTEEASSSEVSMEMMGNSQEEEKEDDRFTPKKVLIYCFIVGLISALLYFHRWIKVAFYGGLCICFNYSMVYLWREIS